MFPHQSVWIPVASGIVMGALKKLVGVIVCDENDPQRGPVTVNGGCELCGLAEVIPPHEIMPVARIGVEQFFGAIVGHEYHVGSTFMRTDSGRKWA